jgi:hypothetical protein
MENSYFYGMTFIQKRRILWASLFQMVILFFILFNVYSETHNPLRFKSDSKSLLCISSGSSVVVREATEQLTTSLSFVKDHNLLEKIWLCAEWFQSSELFTNTSLQISNRVYNTFYFVITIHAP